MADESHENRNSWIALDRWLRRAEAVVSVYTILAGIGGFGLGAFLAGPLAGFYLALCVFGVVGALDVFHRQMIDRLEERRQASGSSVRSHLYFSICDKYPKWKPTILREFDHGGAHFRTFGFDQYRVPLMVSQALCPKCSELLIEKATVRFPARTHIQLKCLCGFSCDSTRTLNELVAEAEHVANVPKDDRKPRARQAITFSLN